MKKFIFIIILFFNIFPIWKDDKIAILNLEKINAQSSSSTGLPQLLNYLNSLNDGNQYQIHNNAIRRIELNNGSAISFIYLSSYLNNVGFNQYLGSQNTSLPPTSNEIPDDGIDWAEVQAEIDVLRFEQRMNAYANIEWWGNIGGNEPVNTLLCDETMSNMSYYENFYDGKIEPPFISNPITLGQTNNPCSNNFLLGGNIIHFNSSQLSNISNYNFYNNFLNSIDFINGDKYKRAINCDVIEQRFSFDSYSEYCPPDNETFMYKLLNKRGSYDYVCFPKLSSLASVTSLTDDENQNFFIGVPDNLGGYSFSIDNSNIVPAQIGNTVLGLNSSGANSCQTLDCANVPNGSASIDNCGACKGGSTGQQPCSQTPSSAVYYTTLNSDTTKYYDKDTIFIPQRNVDVKLTIHKKDGSLASTDLIWKRIDSVKCTNTLECFVSSNTLGVTVVRVDSANKVLIKNPLAIYKVPTLYFKRGNNYNGEYGFDDSTHKYMHIRTNQLYKNGYEVKKIMQNNAYYVPWMSLINNQTAVIRDSIINITSQMKKDVNGYIEFKSSNSSILVNSLTNFRTYYSEIKDTSILPIRAFEWNNNESLKAIGSVYAITNTGDTIGKLNLSCQKPKKRKVVLVYVNTGSGYRTNLSKDDIVDPLNANSHNQFFRKWSIDSAYSSAGKDTLDLTSESLDTSTFLHHNQIFSKIDDYYKNHKGIDIYDVNGSYQQGLDSVDFRKHYVFIFNYSLPFYGGFRTDGLSMTGGYKALIWNPSFKQTIAHEFGHLLSLVHTFSNAMPINLPPVIIGGGLQIPKNTSQNNFMDYLEPDTSDNFFYAQWITVY